MCADREAEGPRFASERAALYLAKAQEWVHLLCGDIGKDSPTCEDYEPTGRPALSAAKSLPHCE